jgi:hypothetical protein
MEEQQLHIDWGRVFNFLPILYATHFQQKQHVQIHKVVMEIWIHNSFFQIHKQNSFNMSKLPSCEKNYLKWFINVLRTYGLNQQRSCNIEGIESCRLEHKES